jgi:hypothetical protein
MAGMGRREAGVVLYLAVVVIACALLPGVRADIVNALAATDCQLLNASQSLACFQNVYAQCDVNDTTAAIAVNSVYFTFGSQTYAACQINATTGACLNQTTKSGTWRVSVPVDPFLPSSLSSVSVTNSNALTCTASDNAQPPSVPEGCLITYANVVRNYTNACQCNYTTIEHACTTQNTKLVEYVPIEGCGLTAQNRTEVCDYCNPGWVYSYGVCLGNRSSSLVGTMRAQYLSTNPACCNETALASDCNPPGAAQDVSCQEDYWCGAGRNAEGSYSRFLRSSETTQFSNTSYVLNMTGLVLSTRMPGTADDPVLQPIIYDWLNEGKSTILLQTGRPGGGWAGLTIVEANASSGEVDLRGSTTVGIMNSYWEGQGSLWGFGQYYENGVRKYAFDDAAMNRTVGGGFAGIVYDASTASDHFVAYRFNSSGAVNTADIDVADISCTACLDSGDSDYKASGRGARSMGVACFLDECYFMTMNNLLVRVDPRDGSYKSMNVLRPYGGEISPVQSGASIDVNSIPSLVVSNTPVGEYYANGTPRVMAVGVNSVTSNSILMNYVSVYPYGYRAEGNTSWYEFGYDWKTCFDGQYYCGYKPTPFPIPDVYFSNGWVVALMEDGETHTYEMTGVDYEVTVSFGGGGGTVIVNGESVSLDQKECGMLSGGFVVCMGSTALSHGVVMLNDDPDGLLTDSLLLSSNPVVTNILATKVNSASDRVELFYSKKSMSSPLVAQTVHRITNTRGVESQSQSYAENLLTSTNISMSDLSAGRGYGSVLPYGVYQAQRYNVAGASGYVLQYMSWDPDTNSLQIASVLQAINTTTDVGLNASVYPKAWVVTPIDYNQNAMEEVVLPTGIYDVRVGGGKLMDLRQYSSGSATVESDDVNSDGQLDLVIANSDSLYVLLSQRVTRQAYYCENLVVPSMQCVAGDGGLITARVPQYCGPYPTRVTWKADLYRVSDGLLISSNPSSQDMNSLMVLPDQLFSVAEPGTYRVQATIHDVYSNTYLYKNCTVIQNSFAAVEGPANTSCVLGDDGEFNYDGDSVEDHNWILSSSSMPLIAGGVAKFNSQPIVMYHQATCPVVGWDIETKVMPVMNMDMTFNVLASVEDASRGGGMWPETVGGIRIKDGLIKVLTTTGETSTSYVVSDNTWYTIKMVFDATGQKFNLSVNGVGVGIYPYTKKQSGYFQGLEIKNNYCADALTCGSKFDMDYVRTVGTSNTWYTELSSNQSDLIRAKPVLAQCRNAGSVENYDPHVGIPHDHLDSFCTSVSRGRANSWCTTSDLRNAISVNSNCYLEAFSYCVDITYPKTAGFADESGATAGQMSAEEIQSNGLDGVTACTAALGVQVGTQRMLVPAWRATWGIVTANVVMVLALVLVVAVVVAARRK